LLQKLSIVLDEFAIIYIVTILMMKILATDLVT
jgi:hypothetical protein